MKLNDILWLGLKGMSERKLRTGLTVLSVVIGISAIVALIALVSGLSASVTKELQSIGPTTLVLTPKGQSIFTAADVAEIESFPNISTVIPLLRFSANITSAGTTSTVSVYGIENTSLSSAIGGLNFQEGALYTDSAEPTAVVGHDIAYPTSTQIQPAISLNQPIYLTSSSKTITLIPVGLLNSYGSSFIISPDSSVFISLSEAEQLSDKYSFNMLLVQASNTSTVSNVDTLLTDVYGSKASILSVQSIASTVSSITGSLGLLLGAIAGISLLVAGISILSIMMVSVAERTHEIGILKSIGFKRRDILYLFLSEALIIGLLGGIVGVTLGAGASYAVAGVFSHASPSSTGAAAASTTPARSSSFGGGGAGSFSGGAPAGGSGAVFVGSSTSASSASSSTSTSLSFTPSISIGLIALAIFVSIFVCVVATLYPAWKASTIDPITALRSE